MEKSTKNDENNLKNNHRLKIIFQKVWNSKKNDKECKKHAKKLFFSVCDVAYVKKDGVMKRIFHIAGRHMLYSIYSG